MRAYKTFEKEYYVLIAELIVSFNTNYLFFIFNGNNLKIEKFGVCVCVF